MIIRVSVEDALNILRTNRENHIKEYETQVKGWKMSMDNWQRELAKWKDSVSTDVSSFENNLSKRPQEPHKPKSYIEDYDRYIFMLEWHQDPAITLTEGEFNQIIKNEFNWMGGFITSSNIYSNNISATGLSSGSL